MADAYDKFLDVQCRQLALDSFTAGSAYLTAIGEPPLGTLWTLAQHVVAAWHMPTGDPTLDIALAELKAFVKPAQEG